MNDMQLRPDFPDPQSYVDDCRRAIGDHQYPWPAASRDELIAVVLTMPNMAQLFWPGPDQRARWDLPDRPEQLRDQLSDDAKAQLMWALVEDEQFRSTVGHLIGGGAVNE